MRTTLKLIATAAITVLASAASYAAEPENATFTRDGHTYVYTQTPRAQGGYLLTGYEKGSRQRFRLVVEDGRVRGFSNGYPVAFRAPEGTAFVVASK